MTLRIFLNALKSLSFIDKQDWMNDVQWVNFRRDPVNYFLRTDDETQERIWKLIQPKEPV